MKENKKELNKTPVREDKYIDKDRYKSSISNKDLVFSFIVSAVFIVALVSLIFSSIS